MRKYGFNIARSLVEDTLAAPHRVDRRDDQLFALKPISQEFAIRVVYKLVNHNIVVVTFYPVKRQRFDV